jgi:hypothetical protein
MEADFSHGGRGEENTKATSEDGGLRMEKLG